MKRKTRVEVISDRATVHGILAVVLGFAQERGGKMSDLDFSPATRGRVRARATVLLPDTDGGAVGRG